MFTTKRPNTSEQEELLTTIGKKRKKEKRGDKKGNQTKQKIKETKTPPTPTTKIYKKMLSENTNWKKKKSPLPSLQQNLKVKHNS